MAVMSEQVSKCKCPLCGDEGAQSVELTGLATQRIECPTCTTYEISEGLKQILATEPEAKGRARLLSDAARRATHGTYANILEHCLKLTEANYAALAADEEGFQHSVQPVVDYLVDNGIEVQGKGRHSFVYLELLLPGHKRTTLKVEESLFTDWTPAELESHCRDFDVAGQLATTYTGQKFVEITRSAAKPRPERGRA
jgi:hypothetical protein